MSRLNWHLCKYSASIVVCSYCHCSSDFICLSLSGSNLLGKAVLLAFCLYCWTLCRLYCLWSFLVWCPLGQDSIVSVPDLFLFIYFFKIKIFLVCGNYKYINLYDVLACTWLAKISGDTSMTHDGGKYWSFPGNNGILRELLGFTGKFHNMTIIDPFILTVMILSFRADMPGQTVQTQIRLLGVYTVCHSICIVWTHYSMIEPHCSNFRVITTNILGVRIFRKFTVNHWHIYYSLSDKDHFFPNHVSTSVVNVFS